MPQRYTFPSWVTQVSDPQKQQAARLRYILYKALLERYGRVNIHGLSKDIGFDHSSVFCALSRGSMTHEMATAIERCVGRDLVSHEDLINPALV